MKKVMERVRGTNTNTLTQHEQKLIGDYSDVLVKDGLDAAKRFLAKLPDPPTPEVKSLLQTAEFLYLSRAR